MIKKQQLKCVVAFAGICFFWGTSNLVTKIGVGGLPTSVFACLWYLLAGFVFLLFAVFKREHLPADPKTIGKLLVTGVIMHFGTNGCVVLSNKLIDSGVVTILLATVPIFSALLQIFAFHTERLRFSTFFGLVGGFTGILLVASSGSGTQHMNCMGIILGLFGAFLWAVGSILTSRLKLKGGLLSSTALQMLFVSCLFLITGSASGSFKVPEFSWTLFWPVVYMALVDSTLGFLLYSWLLQVWDPLKTSTYAYINPVVALILGALILDESISAGKVAGMVLIIISVVLIQKKNFIKGKLISQN